MLSQFLAAEVFAFFLVFCRLGSAFMLLPGFGEEFVSPRVRLLLALMFSLLLWPVIGAMPAPPSSVAGMFMLMFAEILTGLFLGGLTRMLIAAAHIAGSVIAYQSNLTTALTLDISQLGSQQDSTISNLLSLTVVVLIFATDLHHLILKTLADSYTLFIPGTFPPIADFAQYSTKVMSGVFVMAMQLAAPHIVIGLLLYLASGIISRLMPNIQIFFIMMAPQLLISFIVLMLVFSAMMMWYLDYFQESMGAFLAP